MEQDQIELADLLEAYPTATASNFQQIISDKEEFASLASSVSEKVPVFPQRYFKHQELTHRFLRQYDDLLVLSETGTGKTSEVLGFTEAVRDQVLLAELHPEQADEKLAHFRGVVVLSKSKTQKAELRSQLVCKVSQGRYLSERLAKATSETDQKRAVTAEVTKWYDFTTYQKFANQLAKLNDAQVADKYADRIFWVDEAHNLIVEENGEAIGTQKQETTKAIWRVFHIAPRCKRVVSSATPMINGVEDLRTLMNLLLPDREMPRYYDYTSLSKWERRAFFSAAPEDFDFESAAPEDAARYFQGQIPEGFLTECAEDAKNGLKRVEPYLRGRVSFVRALETGAVPVYQGERAGDYAEGGGETIVFGAEMSEFQESTFCGVSEGSFGGAARQASNFVFPDGSYGTESNKELKAAQKEEKRLRKELERAGSSSSSSRPVNRAARTQRDTGEGPEREAEGAEKILTNRAYGRYIEADGDEFKIKPEFATYLSDTKNIKRSGCKFYNICELASEEDSGNCFVYGEYVSGSGAIVLAACLEKGYGMTRFKENSSVFEASGGTLLRAYCSSTGGARRLTRAYDKKRYSKSGKYTYALLTRDTKDARAAAIMEAMNSPENKHGDLIKVLIASRIGRDGINVSNVLQIHLVGPEWTTASMYQAISRGVRATSHENLLEDERRRLREANLPESLARIEIKVYLHAAIPSGCNSSDLHMYQAAEGKAKSIARVMRFCKQTANTCNIHYQRNVRSTDRDYSAACDYDLCRYSCFLPPSEDRDYSTYDITYAEEVVDAAAADVVHTFGQTNAMPFEELCKRLAAFRPKYVGMALEKLITSKTPVTDRFGYVSYLREDAGGFYLDRDYPTGTKASYDLSLYTSGMLGQHPSTLRSAMVRIDKDTFQNRARALETLSGEKLLKQLGAFPTPVKAQVLEEVLLRYSRGDKSAFVRTVMAKFKWYIYQMKEPVRQIRDERDARDTDVPHVGRPSSGEVKLEKLTALRRDALARDGYFDVDETSETVYLHTLGTIETGNVNVKYSDVARFLKAQGTTRILKLSESDKWRDLDPAERRPYNLFIQKEILDKFEQYNGNDYYGTVINGTFRIVNKKMQEKKKATASKKGVNLDNNAKHDFKGKDCKSWGPEELFDCLYSLRIEPPASDESESSALPSVALMRREVIAKFSSLKKSVASYSEDKLRFVHRWLKVRPAGGKTGSDYCPFIAAGMREKNLLIEIS